MSNANPKKPTIDSGEKSELEKHPDDVIVAPKGSSRARFLMTFLLVVMVLTTFSVSDKVVGVLGGRDKTLGAYMSWKAADGSTRTLSGPDFLLQKRGLLQLVRFGLLEGVQGDHDLTDDQAATFILNDDAAKDAGVRVTSAEVDKIIQAIFKTSQDYSAFLQNFRTSARDFKEALQRGLRVARYHDLVVAAFSVADPAALEKTWKAQHQEYAFDYVELPVATLVGEAKAAAPKGDELKTWFDALTQPEKDKYKTKPLVSAELVAFSLEGDVPTDKLYAKYPRPQGEDLDKLARDYHAAFGKTHFRVQFEAGKPQPPTLERPYDEVKDAALKEAPIYNSLMDWVKDLTARAAKNEPIDLSAEAALLGLTFRKQGENLNLDAWKDLQIPWVGKRTLEVLFGQDVKDGQLLPAIAVDEKGFVFARILERKPEQMPEFKDIEPQVATAWADKKAREMATERLEKLRDKFGTRPDPKDTAAAPFAPESDSDKFAAAAKEAGYEVKHREFKDRFAQSPTEETAGETFIRQDQVLYTLKENSVSPAELNRDGTTAYVVRIAGVRDPDTARINLNELDNLAKRTAAMDQQRFRQKLVFPTKDDLVARFALDLESWHSDRKKAD